MPSMGIAQVSFLCGKRDGCWGPLCTGPHRVPPCLLILPSVNVWYMFITRILQLISLLSLFWGQTFTGLHPRVV